MTHIEAMKQALEALEAAIDHLAKPYSTQAQYAITSLRQAIAEVEKQEPVAFIKGGGWRDGKLEVIAARMCQTFEIDQPLYTSPPQRQPLTDEQIMSLCAAEWTSHPIEVARVIEAAHGIGEKK